MYIKKDKSLKISAARPQTLHGVKIYKLPIKKYIQVLKTFDDIPQIILGKAFPDMGASEIFSHLKTLDKDGLLKLMGRLLTVVPDEAFNILSELLDIPREQLDEMGLSEITEVLVAFWKVNDMTAFFVNARQLMAGVKGQITGSSAGLQSHKA